MTRTNFYVLLFTLLIGSLAYSSNKVMYAKHFSCNQNQEYSNSINDTAQIVYEILLRTISEHQIPDFNKINNKNNIFVLNTFFLPHCSGQDTTSYNQFRLVRNLPNKIGNTHFCLKTKEELKYLADKLNEDVVALQIGYITIKGDTAITGIQTHPVPPTKKYVMYGGGGHFKFRRVEGKWVYLGKVYCDWIS